MKRLVAFICVFIAVFSIGALSFADYDFSNLSDEEFTELVSAVDKELRNRSRVNAGSSTLANDTSTGFDPLVFSGTGDKVISISSVAAPYVFEVNGNAGSHYFGVIAYDASGDRLSALVNTTDVYHGIVLDSKQRTVALEVKSSDPWEIKVLPLSSMKTVTKGATITGSGDSVFLFSPEAGESLTASITGNKGENYFGVIGYSAAIDRITAFVNTTDSYNGEVMIKKNPRIFEIKATGDWSVTFQ